MDSQVQNDYLTHFLFFIAAPSIFELILNVIRPIMSPLTRRTLKVYNANKQSWQTELLRIVDKEELPVEYGGTNEV